MDNGSVSGRIPCRSLMSPRSLLPSSIAPAQYHIAPRSVAPCIMIAVQSGDSDDSGRPSPRATSMTLRFAILVIACIMNRGLRAVAQLGSALRSGRRGRGFKSRQPDHSQGFECDSKPCFFSPRSDIPPPHIPSWEHLSSTHRPNEPTSEFSARAAPRTTAQRITTAHALSKAPNGTNQRPNPLRGQRPAQPRRESRHMHPTHASMHHSHWA